MLIIRNLNLISIQSWTYPGLSGITSLSSFMASMCFLKAEFRVHLGRGQVNCQVMYFKIKTASDWQL